MVEVILLDPNEANQGLYEMLREIAFKSIDCAIFNFAKRTSHLMIVSLTMFQKDYIMEETRTNITCMIDDLAEVFMAIALTLWVVIVRSWIISFANNHGECPFSTEGR